MKPIQISVDDDYNLKDFYTIKQVHGLLELPWRMQIHRRFEARGIPSYNFSKMTLFKRAQVDEYLWENCPNNYRDKVALRESLYGRPHSISVLGNGGPKHGLLSMRGILPDDL